MPHFPDNTLAHSDNHMGVEQMLVAGIKIGANRSDL